MNARLKCWWWWWRRLRHQSLRSKQNRHEGDPTLSLLSYLQTPQVPRTSSSTNNWSGRFLVPFFTAFSALVKLRRIARSGRDITERVRARIACAPSQLRRKFETLSLGSIAMSVTTSKLPFSRSEVARQTHQTRTRGWWGDYVMTCQRLSASLPVCFVAAMYTVDSH